MDCLGPASTPAQSLFSRGKSYLREKFEVAIKLIERVKVFNEIPLFLCW